MAITTLANVKAWLGITSNDDDALLTRLISAASAFAIEWTGCAFEPTSYTVKRDGNGAFRMVLPQTPLISVQSLTVDGVAISAATGFLDDGYRIDDISIILNCRRFTRGFANVAVTFTAGYAAVPADVEQAVIELISLRYKERDRIGYQSKTLAGETITFMTSDMSQSARAILEQYKRVVPA